MMEIKDPKLAEQVKAWEADHKRTKRMERRYTPADLPEELQNRMNFEDPKKPKMIGYAAVFNQRAEIWPGFWEQISPGAFRNAIAGDDVRALLNHDPNFVLGRTQAGTLQLSEDDHGLKYEIMLPDTSYAKDLQVSVKLRNITQSSFGFNIIDEDVQHDKTSVTRTIKDVKLFDVSPVTFPAYPSTEVHVRMIAGENEMAYLFEDSGQVIVGPLQADQPVVEELSMEEFSQRIEDLRKRVIR
jgi:uncharacterized protein